MIAYLTILQYFKVTDKNLVDTQLKKKNKKLYRQKKSFLKISYEEKSNILASRVMFLKQEWKPQKETKKKWFPATNNKRI